MHKLLLASNSARRQQLMADAGFEFDVNVIEVDESFDDQMKAGEVAEFLAKKKNEAYRPYFPDKVIVTADTIVIAGDQILGKPKDKEEAYQMIRLISGQVHEVVSGVAISSGDIVKSFSDTVKVEMNELSDEEILFYIDQYRPYDKAGAYGIQEWIGMIGIRQILGSFYTVMGLPIHLVYHSLSKDFGIWPFQNLKSLPAS